MLPCVLAGLAAASAVAAAPYAVAARSAVAGRIFTVAGALRWTGPGADSGLATRAELLGPSVAALADGGFLIADTNNNQVLRVRPTGRISVVAGNGQLRPPPGGSLGDGGPATSAVLAAPQGVAPLPDGGFLIADTYDYVVRRVWPDGHISTVAGGGADGLGDGGPATSASLTGPAAVAPLRDGGFLIADSGDNRIRRVWPDGHISTVAGTGREGFRGDGHAATQARLGSPDGVAALPDGGFLIADTDNCRVRRVSPSGRISTVAGNGRDSYSGDGKPATSAGIGFVGSVAVVPGGGFLLGSEDGGARRVWPGGHISSLVSGAHAALYGDGGPAKDASLYGPEELQNVSVAVAAGSGALIAAGTSVRLVTGRHGTPLLAAAIRPSRSLVTRRAYRARVVLTHRARVTIRLYRSPDGAPVAKRSATVPAGESTVAVSLGRRVGRGLYAVDLTAQHGSQATRAEQYVHLGVSASLRSIGAIENGVMQDAFAGDPNDEESLDRCHQFTRLRVDCAFDGGLPYVEASWLRPSGQIRARTYDRSSNGKGRLFKRRPRWSEGATWQDLGAAWNPGYEVTTPSDPP